MHHTHNSGETQHEYTELFILLPEIIQWPHVFTILHKHIWIQKTNEYSSNSSKDQQISIDTYCINHFSISFLPTLDLAELQFIFELSQHIITIWCANYMPPWRCLPR